MAPGGVFCKLLLASVEPQGNAAVGSIPTLQGEKKR